MDFEIPRLAKAVSELFHKIDLKTNKQRKEQPNKGPLECKGIKALRSMTKTEGQSIGKSFLFSPTWS